MRTLVLALTLACGGGDGPPDPEKASEQAPPEPVTVVETATVGTGSVAEVLVASAVVESEATADIVPEATGVVREIRRDEGDVVEQGDILAVLDNVTLGTGAAKATAEVRRLQQQVDEAKELLTRGAISVREVQDLEFQLETAQMSSREARRTYGSTRLSAPFAGVVAMRQVHVGQLATSAQPAFQIVDPARLRVVASIPERDLGRVSLGQPVRLVSAYDDDVWADGVVNRMAPVVDASSGTFRVTVGVTNAAALRPGQFVSVNIEVDRHAGVVVVPKPALVYEDGVPVVYRVVDAPDEETPDEEPEEEASGGGWWPFGSGGGEDEDEDEAGDEEEDAEDEGPRLVAERILVGLGLVDDAWAEITEGLATGDTIIVVGQSHLRDGARVRAATQEPEPDDEAATQAESAGPAEGDEG